MATARPKTGEKRRTRQPLHMDRLPPEALDTVLSLRNARGKTWEEISALSAEPLKDGGFVDWAKLAPDVQQLFPRRRIPQTTLHRWYDLRVEQVRRDVLHRSEQARTIAGAFAKSLVEDGDEAVLNAARDTIMAVLAEDGSAGGRRAAARALVALAEVMQSARSNDIKERKVATEERRINLLEEREAAQRRKLEEAAKAIEQKRSKGSLRRADVERLVESVFGLPAKAGPAAKAA